MSALLFNLTRKSAGYQQKGVGDLMFIEVRLPFRVFSKEPMKMLFRPAFGGAKWYTLEPGKVDLITLLGQPDAFRAMAYLRAQQADLTSE